MINEETRKALKAFLEYICPDVITYKENLEHMTVGVMRVVCFQRSGDIHRMVWTHAPNDIFNDKLVFVLSMELN